MDWIILNLITNKRNNKLIYGLLFGYPINEIVEWLKKHLNKNDEQANNLIRQVIQTYAPFFNYVNL